MGYNRRKQEIDRTLNDVRKSDTIAAQMLTPPVEINDNVDDWVALGAAGNKVVDDAITRLLLNAGPLLCTYDPAKTDKVVATPRTWEFDDKVLPQDVVKQIGEDH